MEWTEASVALLRSAVAGDSSALAALLTEAEESLRQRIAPRIPSDLRAHLGADDVLQEVYIEVFRSIGRFEQRGPESFERWLATIALRCLRREVRRWRSAKRGGGWGRVQHVAAADESAVTLLRLMEASDSTPSRQAARLEECQALGDVLAGLPEGCAAAVQLVYLEGESLPEVARRLGKTERAVRSLCYRAKVALRELLRPPDRSEGPK